MQQFVMTKLLLLHVVELTVEIFSLLALKFCLQVTHYGVKPKQPFWPSLQLKIWVASMFYLKETPVRTTTRGSNGPQNVTQLTMDQPSGFES
jgi:hypothetical protein